MVKPVFGFLPLQAALLGTATLRDSRDQVAHASVKSKRVIKDDDLVSFELILTF